MRNTVAARHPLLLKAFVGLLLFYPLFTGLAYVYGERYAQTAIPFYQSILAIVAVEYDIPRIEIVKQNSQKLIEAVFVNRDARMVGGRVLPANVDVTVSTLLGHALQHVILIASITAVWMLYRVRSFHHGAALIVLAALGLAFVEAVDVPFVLLGAVQDLVFFQLAPSQILSTPSITWMHLLNGGGRLALSVGAAAIAIAASEWIARRSKRSQAEIRSHW